MYKFIYISKKDIYIPLTGDDATGWTGAGGLYWGI
jgi:hypothetical protein